MRDHFSVALFFSLWVSPALRGTSKMREQDVEEKRSPLKMEDRTENGGQYGRQIGSWKREWEGKKDGAEY